MVDSDVEAKKPSNIGHWELDARSGGLYWSDEVYAIHGMDAGEALNVEEAIDAYHPDDREKVKRYVDRALNFGENYQFELRLIRKSGEMRYVRSTGVVRFDEKGTVKSVFGVFQDITERNRQAAELREKTTMLEQAEQLGQIGHWAIRSDGSLFWSDEVYRIHGLEVGSEIDVEAAINAYHPEDRSKVSYYVDRALNHKEDYEFDLRIVRPSGDIRNVKSTGVVAKSEDGSVESVFGVFKDVTDQKRIEGRLRQAALDADAGNRAKTEFLASMSHELRTPLHSVLGFSQMLEMNPEGNLSAAQRGCVEHILKSGQHLLGLIDDVLDLAKVESDYIDLNFEPLRMEVLIRESIDLLQAKADEAGVSLEYKEGTESAPAIGDAVRARQVIVNLMTNAIKYNREGGSVSIWLESVEGSRVRVCVQDNGIGIPKSKHDQLFKPFNRLGMKASGIEGTGIGLALSQKLAKRMNGQLGFQSEQDQGSTFWLDLPIANEELLDWVARTDAGEESRLALYVEDNTESAALMKLIVSRVRGLEFATLSTHEGVEDFVKEKRPVLVILDLNLPEVSGLEILQRLRSLPEGENLPIFALTAAASEEDIQRGKAAGFDAYFTKPIKVAEILGILRRTLAEAAES